MSGRSPVVRGLKTWIPTATSACHVHTGDLDALDGSGGTNGEVEPFFSRQARRPQSRSVWVSARFVIELLTGDADRR